MSSVDVKGVTVDGIWGSYCSNVQEDVVAPGFVVRAHMV